MASWSITSNYLAGVLSGIPSQLFKQAVSNFQIGRLDEAERYFKKFLRGEPKHFGALNLYAVLLMQSKRFDEAEPLLRKAIAINAQSDKTFYNYGLVLKKIKKFETSLDAFSKAIAINPVSSETWNNRGTVLNDLNRYDEAIADFDRAIALAPNYAEAICNKARSLSATEQVREAITLYRDAIRLKPNLFEAWTGLGLVFLKLKQYEEALSANNTAIKIDRNSVYGWQGNGNIFRELNRNKEALAAYDQVIKMEPGFVAAWVNRGSVFLTLRRYDDALTAFNQAIAIKPDSAHAWVGVGDVYYNLNRYDEASTAYDKALALDDGLATAWHGRGNVLLTFNRDDEAMSCLDKAIDIQPDIAEAHFSKAIVLLSLGNFLDGWKKYEARWKMRNFAQRVEPPFSRKNMWLGEDGLAGKILLVHAEQGLGDTLQFYRYVFELEAYGCRTILAVQTPLVALLLAQEASAQIISSEGHPPDFDLHCPLMSLPLAFKTTLETIPASVPYLSVPSDKLQRWRKTLGKKTKPRIGLAWSGSPLLVRNISRNISLQVLARIIDPAAEWHSLQKDVAESDRAILESIPNLTDHGDSLTDFSETAALIAELDLVISVDTSIAHLAGALGKPVWILLPFHPDFRWLRNRTDSPWYPTARLFRQSRSGDWNEVVESLSKGLEMMFEA